MSPEQFCYWLQGKFEDREGELEVNEILSIRNPLALVFNKVTPEVDREFPLREIDPTFRPLKLSEPRQSSPFRPFYNPNRPAC